MLAIGVTACVPRDTDSEKDTSPARQTKTKLKQITKTKRDKNWTVGGIEKIGTSLQQIAQGGCM